MIGKVFTVIFFAYSLYAASLQSLVEHYKHGDYGYVCTKGLGLFSQLKRSESMVSMYAFSCLKVDKLDRLAVPILILGKSATGRKNRAYFSLILAQKNLLLASLCDGMQLHDLKVPDTEHLISKIFNLYYQKKCKKNDNKYICNSPDAKVHYTIRVQHAKNCSIIVTEQRDGTTTKHIYR